MIYKKKLLILISFIVLITSFSNINAQNIDPLNVKIHTLENGLKVYFSINKKLPQIQTYIAVNAGSKNDPKDATGIAHYLEHLMFKGTNKIGTENFQQEQILLDQIEQLFENFRSTNNPKERENIYAEIDSLSVKASQFAIPNEFDKLLASIGANATNAYTSNDETVYINTIPSNQLANWLDLEFERFFSPVFRLFHTELETVYEEKNQSLDNDNSRCIEALFSNLFTNHPYGTQTTLGSVLHLQNPSIKNVKKFFQTHYIPNNMAIILAGDFDPKFALEKIRATFGKLAPKTYEKINYNVENSATLPKTIEVIGNEQEMLYIGFKIPKSLHNDDLLTMCDMILNNSKVGLIDANISRQQKAQAAFASSLQWQDHSILILGGVPTKGQTLEELKQLLLDQITLLKNGKFAAWLPQAIVNNLKLDEIKSFDNNQARAKKMLKSFTKNIAWNDIISTYDRLEAITSTQIAAFASKFLNNNYVVINKRNGTLPPINKIKKPQLTPIKINNSNNSLFYQQFVKRHTAPLKPVFVDLNNDVRNEKVTINGQQGNVRYLHNNENELFSLRIKIPVGEAHNKLLPVALSYIAYLDSTKFKNSFLHDTFYRLGCEFSLDCDQDFSYINIEGLYKNQEVALRSLFDFFATLINDNKQLQKLQNRLTKELADNAINQKFLFNEALTNFAKYGVKNPINNAVNNNEILSLNGKSLIKIFQQLFLLTPDLLYFGPTSYNDIVAKFKIYWNNVTTKSHNYCSEIQANLLPKKEYFHLKEFTELSNEKRIIFLHIDNMQQTQIAFLHKGEIFNPNNLAIRRIFNHYFGTSMSSIVFQQIRESQALAYTAYAYYSTPKKVSNSHYFFAYAATQPSKALTAINSFSYLINHIPIENSRFEISKNAILNQIITTRYFGMNLLKYVDYLKSMNLNEDVNHQIFKHISHININDLTNFINQNISNKSNTLVIMGNRDNLDLNKIINSTLLPFIEVNTKQLLP